MKQNKLIDTIVLWIFNEDVSLEEPYQTMEEIKEKLKALEEIAK